MNLKMIFIFLILKKKEWKEIETSGDVPSKRSQHSSFVYKSNFFVVGGHNKDLFLRDVYYLNLNTFIWKKIKIRF